VFVKDAQPALAVSLKDVSGADKIELFLDALAAAYITAGWPENETCSWHTCIRAD